MARQGIVMLGAILVARLAGSAETGNRLAYLDEFCDPYSVSLATPKLVTPQWIGQEGVELALVLATDDLVDNPAVYERSLRPVLERLKRIDGRAPVSIMTRHVDPADPQIHAWLREGVSLEAHTWDHPCPCLREHDFQRAKATFDRCVDHLGTIPSHRPVAFRMPCCDSMNTVSPRFYAEIFCRTTPNGRFLALDSSIFVLFTARDAELPRDLVIQPDGVPRFGKYIPKNREFVNCIEDYPYPYVINRLCWELPTAVPDDWQGHHLHQPRNPITVRDMKAAIDAAAIKQGVYVLTFHPDTHAWISPSQVVELVEHAADRYGKKAIFLNFREVYERLTQNLLAGHPLRAANGQDNGVRVLDVNHDGYMDVVIGNRSVRQTRLWSPSRRRWIVGDFPVPLVEVDAEGTSRDAGVRFGILNPNGRASILVRSPQRAGLWHFDGSRWVADSQGLAGLEADGPVFTVLNGRDRGVRLRDLDGDGRCELVVSNPQQNAVFAWSPEQRAWTRLPFRLPPGTLLVDDQGRDAGLRLVDLDGDTRLDLVFSNAQRWSVHLFASLEKGWTQKVAVRQRTEADPMPMIVRADGTNNGVWFRNQHVWVQNEDSGREVAVGATKIPMPVDSRSYREILSAAPTQPSISP